jgi:hypothetical protein
LRCRTQLEERVETTINLEQQLLELQELVPPAPEDTVEINAMLGIDEL